MLKSPAFAECQAQKRRPWTSFFVQLGPGDLNLVGKILIYKNSYRLIFCWNTTWNTALHVTTRFAVDLTARFITMIGSELPIAADSNKQKSTKSRSLRQDSGD